MVAACAAGPRESQDALGADADVARVAEPQPPSSEASATPEAVQIDEAPSEPAMRELCEGRGSPAGTFERTLTIDGRTRRFSVHVPSTEAPRPLPMVLSFHGLTETANANRGYTRFDELGQEHGFVSVFLEGTARSWNGGGCCLPATQTGVDDVRFVSSVISLLTAEMCIDERRVYASGFSNGGFLSYRLACELSSRIAAIGVVGATMALESCNPSRAVPVMHVHGTRDPIVPMPGNPALGFPNADTTIGRWVTTNECTSTPRETLREGNGVCTSWEGCKSDATVSYCVVSDAAHVWPDATFPASRVIWDFFTRHSL